MLDNKYYELFSEIRNCNKCKSILCLNYPQPGLFRKNTNVLFIGQNPGIPKPELIKYDKIIIDKIIDNNQFHFAYEQAQKSWYFFNFINSITNFETSSIINICRCPTRGNIQPSLQMIENCAYSYLEKSIILINPKVIICVGSFSYNIVKKLNLKYKIIHSFHYSYLIRKGKFFYEQQIKKIKNELENGTLSKYI